MRKKVGEKMIRETLKKHPNLIYIIYFIVLLMITYKIHSIMADDLFFQNIAINDLISYLGSRYHEWTSRLIIETLLVTFLHLPKICWCIVTSLVMTTIAWCISYIFTKHNLSTRIISILAISIIPISIMSEAGWYATSINYLWPLAFLLISFIPIKHALTNKKEPIWAYPIYIISALIAGNQEQSCALLLGFYVLFSIYFCWKKKNIPIIYIQTTISLMSIIFILTCPGNNLRSISETALWYPAYENFSIIQKGILGVNSTLSKLLINGSAPFFALSILIILITKNKEKWLKYISFIPLLIIAYIEYFHNNINKLFPNMNNLYETIKNFTQPMNEIHIFSIRNCLLIIISIVIFLSIALCLFEFFKKKKEQSIFIPILLLAGFLSVIIMGFSPTVYASGMRPFTFLNYIMAIIITIIICNMKEKSDGILLVTILSLFQVLNALFI